MWGSVAIVQWARQTPELEGHSLKGKSKRQPIRKPDKPPDAVSEHDNLPVFLFVHGESCSPKQKSDIIDDISRMHVTNSLNL